MPVQSEPHFLLTCHSIFPPQTLTFTPAFLSAHLEFHFVVVVCGRATPGIDIHNKSVALSEVVIIRIRHLKIIWREMLNQQDPPCPTRISLPFLAKDKQQAKNQKSITPASVSVMEYPLLTRRLPEDSCHSFYWQHRVGLGGEIRARTGPFIITFN